MGHMQPIKKNLTIIQYIIILNKPNDNFHYFKMFNNVSQNKIGSHGF